MTHKLKTETFSQKIEYSGGVFFGPLTPLFSFVTFHLKSAFEDISNVFRQTGIDILINLFSVCLEYTAIIRHAVGFPCLPFLDLDKLSDQ